MTLDTPAADAVLIAPDRSTVDRLSDVMTAIDRSFDSMPSGAVLEVPIGDNAERIALAGWCLDAGRPIRDPFARRDDHRLLIEKPAPVVVVG